MEKGKDRRDKVQERSRLERSVSFEESNNDRVLAPSAPKDSSNMNHPIK